MRTGPGAPPETKVLRGGVLRAGVLPPGRGARRPGRSSLAAGATSGRASESGTAGAGGHRRPTGRHDRSTHEDEDEDEDERDPAQRQHDGLRLFRGRGDVVTPLVVIAAVVVVLLGVLGVRVVKQYEQGVLFRLGRLVGVRGPGLHLIVPVVDVLHRVSRRIVTMPIQSQGIITRDNVSVDVSAVAYFRVVDAVKSVVAIENVRVAIDQIAQTTLRKVVGQHTLDETLSETDRINVDIREILDITTIDWGVEVTLVELKDIQLPDTMKRAMARQAEAEREKRAKIISAEGESLAATALGEASDIMVAHPLALQLRNLQSMVEIGVDKNTTVVFPAPLMSTIAELGSFLARETAAAEAAPVPGPPRPLLAAAQPTAVRDLGPVG